MTRAAMRELLAAVNTMAVNCHCAPEVLSFWDALDYKKREEKVDSFTALWEKELHEHFSSAAYVPLSQGCKIGNVFVEKQLSMSALAATYLVADAHGFESVLKECVIPENATESSRQKSLEMFQREASLLARLSHPGLVKVRDHFVSADRQYLLMERAGGRTLRQLVRDEGVQEEKNVIAWAAQIAEILEYMHGHIPPIIQRDISPENVLIAEDGSVKLVDFGAAREVLGTATGTIVGKLSYMAPEQFRGKAEPGSDIYGLGCLMQFLLSGKDPIPFSTADMSEYSVSSELASVITACTQENPKDRPEEILCALQCISICQVETTLSAR
jgi:serine/threonine-protein kinase